MIALLHPGWVETDFADKDFEKHKVQMAADIYGTKGAEINCERAHTRAEGCMGRLRQKSLVKLAII